MDLSVKATFEIDEAVLRALWRKAALQKRSVSEMAEEVLRASLDMHLLAPPPLPASPPESPAPAQSA
jgi:hypothetical protein